jgi:hypothetical protein
MAIHPAPEWLKQCMLDAFQSEIMLFIHQKSSVVTPFWSLQYMNERHLHLIRASLVIIYFFPATAESRASGCRSIQPAPGVHSRDFHLNS